MLIGPAGGSSVDAYQQRGDRARLNFRLDRMLANARSLSLADPSGDISVAITKSLDIMIQLRKQGTMERCLVYAVQGTPAKRELELALAGLSPRRFGQ